MGTASVRRKRKDKAIIDSSSLFSDFIESGDYDSAASVVYWATLEVSGSQGIMDALDDANSFISTKDIRRGI